ncbi:MAG: ABC transporter ATP-binding protein [Verrucomicrobia bacterium]|nr:ABC transporter ATP-binding protein [Verrucomicrobiota bacterium]
MEFLTIDHVSKVYPLLDENAKKNDTFVVFKNVSFEIRQGEFLTMIGHSGCGKSTLLNIIAGFDKPTEGGVILEGREVDRPGLDRMVVFQNFALMPWLTAFDNVRTAVRQAHPDWTKSRIRDWTQKYIDLMNLRGAETKKPAFLSGGMRQRVGLARAFSVEPKVLLLDEPFAQIDALTRGSIQEELIRMWDATKNTVFMVTHDVDEAILLSDRIALMTNGPDAELAEILEVDIPRPRTRETLIDSPEYTRLRNHILHFLVKGAKRGSGAKQSGASAERSNPPPVGAPSTDRESVVQEEEDVLKP